MRLIRLALGIFNRGTKQKGLVDYIPKSNRGPGRHSQVGNGLNPTSYETVSGRLDKACSEHDIYKTAIVAEGGANLKVDDRSLNHPLYRDQGLFAGRFGVVRHDGSYNFFEWDRAAGCMVALELSNPKVN